jgi:hypothetical protein
MTMDPEGRFDLSNEVLVVIHEVRIAEISIILRMNRLQAWRKVCHNHIRSMKRKKGFVLFMESKRKKPVVEANRDIPELWNLDPVHDRSRSIGCRKRIPTEIGPVGTGTKGYTIDLLNALGTGVFSHRKGSIAIVIMVTRAMDDPIFSIDLLQGRDDFLVMMPTVTSISSKDCNVSGLVVLE